MSMTRVTLAAAFMAVLVAGVHGANPPDDQRAVDLRARDSFRTGSELVATAVTVRDADGRLITNLQQKDFTVEEDGVPQPITQFTADRVPVSVSLAIDISDSMRGQRIADARGAIVRFLDSLLKPEDEASLLGFNHAARLFAPWSTDRAPLRARLDDLKPSGGTALYDALDVALPLFASREHPRAAIVLVSDGADTASDITPTKLKQKLNRSDVFLYAIGISSLDAKNPRGINPYTLNELTSQGGGYTEIVNSPADLGPATERIAEELNHQYVIGYSPIARADGKYHSVRVKVANTAYKVRARRGVQR